MGPWAHGVGARRVGQLDFGEHAERDHLPAFIEDDVARGGDDLARDHFRTFA